MCFSPMRLSNRESKFYLQIFFKRKSMYSSLFTLLKCMFMYHCNLGSSIDEDEMAVGDEIKVKAISRDLEQQISNAIDPRFLLQLVCHPNICHISV